MRKILPLFIVLLIGVFPAFAQKTKTAKTEEVAPKVEKGPKYRKLPQSSTDCNYALTLDKDTIMDMIAPPNGAGYLFEVKKDASNPDVFDKEHNVVWYKLEVPYSSKLSLDITTIDSADDYDFLLYKASDIYFCNKLVNQKVKPILSNLSAPSAEAENPSIGVSLKGTHKFIGKKSKESHTATVEMKKGETYYLVLDNAGEKPGPYSMKLQYYVEGTKPLLRIFDGKTRRQINADVLITEKSTGNIAFDKKNIRASFLVFEPNFEYHMEINKEGYFAYKEDFNSDKYLQDSSINIRIFKVEVGAKYILKDIYFEDGLTELLPESEPALQNIVDMMNEYPAITISIQGFTNTDGENIAEDVTITEGRAKSVQKFFEEKGIKPERMTAMGMDTKELKLQADRLLRGEDALIEKKIEIKITNVATE